MSVKRNLRELEDELWEMDVDAICAEFSDDPGQYDYYRPEPEEVYEEEYEEPAAVYVADRKALKARRKEEKREAKRRRQKGIGALSAIAILELCGIIGVLLYWLRFFL